MVKVGDSFTTIAEKTCISVQRLQELNPNLDDSFGTPAAELRRSGPRRLQGPRKRVAAALALAVLAAASFAAPRRAAADPPRDLPAAAWVLVDADDGAVLAAHRAGSERPIASTTKLMTAYVARRDLRLGETVVAPPYEALAAESLLGLEAGEEIEVRDLLYGLLLASGNDAAVALAEAAARIRGRFRRRDEPARPTTSASRTRPTRTRSASTRSATTRAPRTSSS